MRVFGIETEYGVSAPGSEVPAEVLSELVIRAVAGPGRPPDAATGAHAIAAATLAPDDLAANRMLTNGARAYVDHAHPEYSSPETTSPTALVAYDHAGDRLLGEAARRASEASGLTIRLYRNTCDGKGASYGRHENHLVDRGTPWQRIVDVMTGFLVARVPLVGAGRVGLGQRGTTPGFQISQRADFLVTPIGLQTTHDRPILNTRDEPHADPRRWRRLHVITGDPAWSHHQTWLTVGTAALVLAAVEADAVAPVRWADPVEALQRFSHDPTLTATARTVEGARLTCLDALEQSLDACVAYAGRYGEALGAETRPLLHAWRVLLDDLRRDVDSAADRLDWVAKARLLERLRHRTGAPWDDPRLAAVDLLWADVDSSPAHRLADRGESVLLVTEHDIRTACSAPPPHTRAWLRGTLLRRFPDAVVAPAWDHLTLRRRDGRLHRLPMPDPLGHTRAAAVAAESAVDLDAVLEALARGGGIVAPPPVGPVAPPTAWPVAPPTAGPVAPPTAGQ